jgi:hypothetical protein
MPCHDSRNDPPATQYNYPQPTDTWAETRRHELARMLCEACGLLFPIIPPGTLVSNELRAWWEQHQREDAARKLLEETKQTAYEVKQAALKKLTPKERRVLGL